MLAAEGQFLGRVAHDENGDARMHKTGQVADAGRTLGRSATRSQRGRRCVLGVVSGIVLLSTACSGAHPATLATGMATSASTSAQKDPGQSSSITSPNENTSGQALWAQMRDGPGYVVMLRHTSTEPGTGDPPGFVLTDCATQRNLSSAGRAEARRLGERFLAQGVPVRKVASSRYCRCLETATLLGLGPVTRHSVLDSLFDEDQSAVDLRTALVRDLVVAHRYEKGVLVLVTHQVNIAAATGHSPDPGDAVVIRADTSGEVRTVGVLDGL